jgi:glucose/arabinose dehydrogenase
MDCRSSLMPARYSGWHTLVNRSARILLLALLSSVWPVAPQTHAAPFPPEHEPATEESIHQAITAGSRFTMTTIAEPFEHPWSIAFLPDGGILVTEKPGRLRLLRDGVLLPDPIGGTPEVLTGDHAGLLDIVVDPDFERSRLLFLSYIHGSQEAATVRIMRAQLDGTQLAEQEVIFESRPPAPGLDQFGGRLSLDRDGFLYLTLGDRFRGWPAQDLGDHAGSIVRIGRDGRVPGDNPFIAVPGALPEIFTIGHRNPQGLALEPAGRRLWSNEHGPKGGDELNIIRAGHNYGWPPITYGVDYDDNPIGIGTEAPGMDQPVHYWVPSVAPSSLTFYEGDRFPDWRGNLLVGTLRGQLLRLELAGDLVVGEEQLIEELVGRIRDVRTGPDGYVYLVNDTPEGGLYRLEPTYEQTTQAPRQPTLEEVDFLIVEPPD